jgi:hypothetical protein
MQSPRTAEPAKPDPQAIAQDLTDLQRLIQYVGQRRARIQEATGSAFDRRVADATILLGKLWVAVMSLRLQGVQPQDVQSA